MREEISRDEGIEQLLRKREEMVLVVVRHG